MIKVEDGIVEIKGDSLKLINETSNVLLGVLTILKGDLRESADPKETLENTLSIIVGGAVEKFNNRTGIGLLEDDEEPVQEFTVPADKLKDFLEGKELLF